MGHHTVVDQHPATAAPQSTPTRGDTAVRVAGHRVRTAVWTLVHPLTGRTVTLLGTMHIGDAGYFRQLSAVLAGLAAAGAEVHVEGIGERDDDRPSEWERDRLAEAGAWEDPEKAGAVVALLQLASQGELVIPKGARNVDMSHLELLRRVGWRHYRRLVAPQPESPVTAGLGPAVRAILRLQLRHQRFFEGLQSLRRSHRQVNRVVIQERNRVAFAGAREALTRGDVVLVWGPDHLPGLARLFCDAGYRRHHEEWFEACTI